jgi:AcrR family transcriptional regulator
MNTQTLTTRDRIIEAASRLFYREGVRSVSVDTIAEAAGVTKRTFYYHFKTKDEVIAAYLTARDQPNLAQYRKWFAETEGGSGARIEGIFLKLAALAARPKWRGCGFLRTSAELASFPGHPAVVAGSAHKKRFEAWLADIFSGDGVADPALLARQIMLIIDGAFAVVMLHRDPSYMLTAGQTARGLIDSAARSVPCA